MKSLNTYPVVSIITISLNNENTIRSTIESVLNQSYRNIEYIIIDGNSTDRTVDIANEYRSAIDKIISEKDNGIYDAINKGIRNSSGDIVGLVHAGDRLFDDNVINKIVTHFLTNDIDVSYGHSVIVNKKDKAVRINRSPIFNKNLLKRGWMPSHQSVYIRRNLFDELGYYRTDIGGSGDYEFVLRYFYFNNIKIKLLDEYILKFALGGVSTTNYSRLFKRQQIHKYCWKINGGIPPIYFIPMKLIRKIPQFFRAVINNVCS